MKLLPIIPKFSLTILLSIFCFFVNAQSEPFAVKLNGRTISVEEFQNTYKKLIQSDSVNKNNQKDFLENFINFKIKILAAEKMGKDTTLLFRDQLNTYRRELALPYLTDKTLMDRIIQETYERMREEVRVAHLLIKIPKNASPADTMIAYDEIKNLKTRIQRGEAFEQIAKNYSQDPISAKVGGDLGFITSLKTSFPFENAAYTTSKGDISNIIRTEQGFHFLKVLDRRSYKGKAKFAHIFVGINPTASQAEKDLAKKRIDEAYAFLQKGEKFEGVCRGLSDDINSKDKGGELKSWYFATDLEDAFADAGFALKEKGDYSTPIQTSKGWHIIRLIDKKGLLKFEELAPFIRQKVNSDPTRNALGKGNLVRKLKKDNNFLEVESVRQEAFDAFSRDRTGKEDYLNKTIFSINQRNSTVRQFYDFVQKQQKQLLKIGASLDKSPKEWYNLFVENENIRYEELNLEVKYPEFRALVQEYREGILYQEMMEENVFDKSLDSLAQVKFFKQNSAKYQYTNRVLAKIITTDRRETMEQVRPILTKTAYPLNRLFPNMMFDKDQSDINEVIKKQCYELAVTMLKNQDYQVEVSGNSDPEENESVSAERAKKIVNYLIAKGVNATRITEKDDGKYKPVSKTERSKNQRVGIKFFSNSMEDVVKRFNALKPGSLSAEERYFKKGENEYLDAVQWAVGQNNYEIKGKTIWVDIKKVEDARPKTFKEANGEVIRDLQKTLERDWVNRLKVKYPVIVNEEEVKRILN